MSHLDYFALESPTTGYTVVIPISIIAKDLEDSTDAYKNTIPKFITSILETFAVPWAKCHTDREFLRTLFLKFQQFFDPLHFG